MTDVTNTPETLKDIFEWLASIEHDRWCHWQSYLHSKCIKNDDGSLTIPKELVERWDRQINTKYEDLSESEKESDRAEVRKYWNVIYKDEE